MPKKKSDAPQNNIDLGSKSVGQGNRGKGYCCWSISVLCAISNLNNVWKSNLRIYDRRLIVIALTENCCEYYKVRGNSSNPFLLIFIDHLGLLQRPLL